MHQQTTSIKLVAYSCMSCSRLRNESFIRDAEPKKGKKKGRKNNSATTRWEAVPCQDMQRHTFNRLVQRLRFSWAEKKPYKIMNSANYINKTPRIWSWVQGSLLSRRRAHNVSYQIPIPLARIIQNFLLLVAFIFALLFPILFFFFFTFPMRERHGTTE